MKILQFHVDWIEWKPVKKEIDFAEDVETSPVKVDNALVLFVSVEPSDNAEVSKRVIEDAKKFMEQMKVEKLVIYPFAHLSSELAEPIQALKVIKSLVDEAKKQGLRVFQAPFGWNKALSLSVKGHPLAESSKRYEGVEKEEEIEEDEGEMEEYFVIFPDGSIKKREEIEDESILKAIKAELKEISETSFGKPPHVDLMRRLEIADYEKVSDAGNLRFYPKGFLMLKLLGELGRKMAVEDLGAMEVKTPYLINPKEKAVQIMMSKFPERLYRVLPGARAKKQEFRLRPACDYGVWSMWRDSVISYKNLPLGIYELDIMWRYEQRGELLGLYRVRNATMPDLHEMTADLEQAFERFKEHIEKFALAVYRYIGIEPKLIILNCKRDFYQQHLEVFKKWAKELRIPIMVKLFKTMKTYKVAWIDVMAFDRLGRPMEVSTVQLDTESAKWWGIKYVDKDGKEKYPIILHTGFGIERLIAALLENASASQHPTLPLWLSPIQVRLIPLHPKHLEKCLEIAKKLEEKKIRVDIDDREGSLNKKIRNAEMEWIPLIVVIGEKEISSGILKVRIREKGEIREMKVEELINFVEERTRNMPKSKSNLPLLISKRPKFVAAI